MKRFYAPQTRTQEHQIVIDAPSEFVWTALTEAQELPRWLVDREAWVEPRVGGKIWRSWGGGSHEEGRIDVWEPRHRLGLRLEAFTSCGHRYKIRSGITEEFQLVKHGAQTELYLVHAGVPVDSEWDHYYSTTNRAWMMYLRTLRHYLEYHRGKPRRLTKLLARLPGALEEAWLNLAGTCGLSRRLQGENQFTVRTLGTTFSGNVSFVEAPIVFDLIIRELDNALFSGRMGYSGPHGYALTALSVYGETTDRLAALEKRWHEYVSTALPIYGETTDRLAALEKRWTRLVADVLDFRGGVGIANTGF